VVAKIGTVLITASSVFGEIRTALNATFRAKPSDEPIFSLSDAGRPALVSSPQWTHADRFARRERMKAIADAQSSGAQVALGTIQ
jgi:hypothetical protein